MPSSADHRCYCRHRCHRPYRCHRCRCHPDRCRCSHQSSAVRPGCGSSRACRHCGHRGRRRHRDPDHCPGHDPGLDRRRGRRGARQTPRSRPSPTAQGWCHPLPASARRRRDRRRVRMDGATGCCCAGARRTMVTGVEMASRQRDRGSGATGTCNRDAAGQHDFRCDAKPAKRVSAARVRVFIGLLFVVPCAISAASSRLAVGGRSESRHEARLRPHASPPRLAGPSTTESSRRKKAFTSGSSSDGLMGIRPIRQSVAKQPVRGVAATSPRPHSSRAPLRFVRG